MSRPLRRALPLTAALLAIGAGAAAAAPAITSADPDNVWNDQQVGASQVVYTLTAEDEDITWAITRQGSNLPLLSDSDDSPVTVTVPPTFTDGAYTLYAWHDSPLVNTTAQPFTIDRTAPAPPVVTTPAMGATYAQGQSVVADYSCTDATACQGDAPDGGPVDTARTGTRTFTVTASDLAGNVAAVARTYTVVAGPPPASGGGATTGGGGGTPTPPAAPPATTPRDGELRPQVLNTHLLTPRVGRTFTALRPTLRWKARRGASLYNVQLFRVRGPSLQKVLSAFPRRTSYRVPRGRLAAGSRYVWRVWPYMRSARAYSRQPLGISFFTVRKAPARPAR